MYLEVAPVLRRGFLGKKLGRRGRLRSTAAGVEILRPEEALQRHERSVVRFGGLEEAAALELTVALSNGVVLKWKIRKWDVSNIYI